MLADLLYRARVLLRRSSMEDDLEEELRFHLEHEVEKQMRTGLSEEEATRRARLTLGGFDQTKEQCREARGLRIVENLARDLRYAARVLARSRGFTVVSVLCLALGIGANTTIFSLVDGFWTRPLPVRDPGGLTYLSTATPRSARDALSYAEYLDYQSQAKSFSGLLATQRRGPILTGDGFAESTMSNVVSENYFNVLGVEAQLGRVFTGADANTGQRVVVMSHNLWQRRFGGDPGIIGRSVRLNGPYVVVGVAPKEFRGTELWQDSDFWIPITSWDPSERNLRESRNWEVLGRLRPGVSIEAARAEIAGIAANLERAYPKFNKGCRAVLATATEHLFQSTKYVPFILLGIVAVVLLIACANLANLLLARAQGRSREIGVRLAMGASRGRLVSQLMAESALLCALGTAVGLLLAAWLISLLPAVIIPAANSYLHMDFRLDQRVLAFTLITSLVTVFIFGLAPALRASRTDLTLVIKGGDLPDTRRGRLPARSALVVVQMALSLMLLVGAGLLVRTFIYGMNLDLGFERRDVLVAEISPPYDGPRNRAFYRQLIERLKAIPGIGESTLALRAPLSGSGGGLAAQVTIPGRSIQPGDPLSSIKYTAVDLNYFRTLGIRLLRGRDFDAQDGPGRTRVAIINETMSRHFWPGENPIGKTIQLGGETPASECTIVGIVRDTRINSIMEVGEPYFYLAYAQTEFSSMYLIATTGIDPLQLSRPLRAEVAAIDPSVPVVEVTTMKLLVRSQLYQQQVFATIVGGLGAIGLLLAAAGLYGLISYSVTLRTREIGIRMALGAQRRCALGMVLRQTLVLALIGTGAGLIGAVFAVRILSGLVYGVSVRDPITFGAVIVSMLAVAMLAGYIPARRSTQINPMAALRHE
ncbi:MAG: ABC transporter permease [Bryobacteraceae bacterium]|nr:ABC transporter permease [Bryobacteraceae bacterium]